MAATNRAALLDKLPRTFSADPLKAEAKADRTPRADARNAVGKALDRALELAHMTKQELAGALGYSDHSPISRWISGAERLQLDTLWSVKPFRKYLLVALAESEDDCEIEHVIRVRR